MLLFYKTACISRQTLPCWMETFDRLHTCRNFPYTEFSMLWSISLTAPLHYNFHYRWQSLQHRGMAESRDATIITSNFGKQWHVILIIGYVINHFSWCLLRDNGLSECSDYWPSCLNIDFCIEASTGWFYHFKDFGKIWNAVHCHFWTVFCPHSKQAVLLPFPCSCDAGTHWSPLCPSRALQYWKALKIALMSIFKLLWATSKNFDSFFKNEGLVLLRPSEQAVHDWSVFV